MKSSNMQFVILCAIALAEYDSIDGYKDTTLIVQLLQVASIVKMTQEHYEEAQMLGEKAEQLSIDSSNSYSNYWLAHNLSTVYYLISQKKNTRDSIHTYLEKAYLHEEKALHWAGQYYGDSSLIWLASLSNLAYCIYLDIHDSYIRGKSNLKTVAYMNSIVAKYILEHYNPTYPESRQTFKKALSDIFERTLSMPTDTDIVDIFDLVDLLPYEQNKGYIMSVVESYLSKNPEIPYSQCRHIESILDKLNLSYNDSCCQQILSYQYASLRSRYYHTKHYEDASRLDKNRANATNAVNCTCDGLMYVSPGWYTASKPEELADLYLSGELSEDSLYNELLQLNTELLDINKEIKKNVQKKYERLTKSGRHREAISCLDFMLKRGIVDSLGIAPQYFFSAFKAQDSALVEFWFSELEKAYVSKPVSICNRGPSWRYSEYAQSRLLFGDIPKAKYYCEKAIERDLRIPYGAPAEQGLFNIFRLQLAEILLRNGEYKKGEQYVLQYRGYAQRDYINLMQSKDGTSWVYGDFLLNSMPRYAYLYPSDTLISLAYDAILQSKGRSLREEIKVEKAKAEFDRQNSHLYSEIDSLYRIRNSKSQFYWDEFDSIINSKKQELEEARENYINSIPDTSIYDCWRKIRNKLKSTDIAIEFVEIQLSDTTIYVAFVLRSEYNYPKLITLCKIPNKMFSVFFNGNDSIGQIFWTPLLEELKNSKNIFFSPSGVINFIPIENHPFSSDGSENKSNIYNVYRLSSTGQLKQRDGVKRPINTAFIYGGLDYNALLPPNNIFGNRDDNVSLTPQNILQLPETNFDQHSHMFSAPYLPQTYFEALLIDSILNKDGVITQLLTQNLGDELSFRKNTGDSINIIHIATHGFFSSRKTDNSNRNETLQDGVMAGSGLLFAGANNERNIIKDIYGIYSNDGVISAGAISKLRLQGTGLVVLSACETGLGIVSGDGVFGLQRGFKKAGVNSIIMSLWKVDDRATQMLMTQFYENWLIKKMTKQKALKAAQEYVRNFEVDEIEWAIELRKQRDEQRGVGGNFRSKATTGKSKKSQSTSRMIKPYQDPKYWAAFILLDGLD